MADPKVTLVVAARERFSLTQRSLESLYENTQIPFNLVYVDGNSPPDVKQYLERAADERHFKLIRRDYPLLPNEARNIGLREVTTPYVVFLDNDVVLSPGCLEKLLAAAEAQGAWVVGPTYLIGNPKDEIIHMAGGEIHFIEKDGKRRFHEVLRFMDRPMSEVRGELKSEATELLEFHCLLVRTDAFDRIGPLDEDMKSHLDNVDFCLSIAKAGGWFFYEPASVACYVAPPPFAPSDYAHFLQRWSDERTRDTINHFAQKWGVESDDPWLPHLARWATRWRERALRDLMWPLGRIAGHLKYSRLRWLGEPMVKWIESSVLGDLESKRPGGH